MALKIDLNADLGEECGDDAAIFPCLSSANIACGAHAGGGAVMTSALQMAVESGVVIGAHVSYEDRANFGRLPLAVEAGPLTASLQHQITLLQEAAARVGAKVRYVKPHGALYHEIATNPDHAAALVSAVRSCDADMELLAPDSATLRACAGLIPLRHEFFADRGYTSSGQLVSRADPRAHLSDVSTIVERTRYWLQTGEVIAIEGEAVRVAAESICLHGDSPAALAAAVALRSALQSDGYRITNWMLP